MSHIEDYSLSAGSKPPSDLPASGLVAASHPPRSCQADLLNTWAWSHPFLLRWKLLNTVDTIPQTQPHFLPPPPCT